jgi:hypothetical protein
MQNFDGKFLGNGSFKGPKQVCEGNMKMDIREVGCEDRRTELAQDCAQWQALILVMLIILILS